MPLPVQPRVFISYARKDGASLAQRLQTDLRKEGFDPWLDTQRIEGGATWTTKIEDALDQAEFLLALMTKGSYESEICRAEQLRALRKNKCVIPLKAKPGTDIPLHLEAKNYRDFTADSAYASSFKVLLDDLHARNGIELRPEFRATRYDTVPPLPVNFVERPNELVTLRDALIGDDGGRHIALTALQGMGGIGKTVLAQALCHDEVVQHAFPDGVIWVTVGRESAFDAVTRMREVGKALGDDPARYENGLAAKNQYRTTVRQKAALIVVDDVWTAADLEPLRAESPRSRLLFTTRDAGIAAAVGAREHVANLLSPEQSCEVFARWSGSDADKLPTIAADVIKECGRLPLALSMVGAMVRGKPTAYWKTVLDNLRHADLERIKTQFPDYPYTDILRAIQVSVDLLDAKARERYLALAVLLEEMAAPPQVQKCIWGVDEDEAVESAEQFISLSLAQRGETEGSIKLHDLQLDYVRAQYPDKQALELIHGAIQLSSNVIANDASQFASQMSGRLLPQRKLPVIYEFTERVTEGVRECWLRPLRATLHPAGTALMRTLEGHTDEVRGVALSADGRLAVSASGDKTLKVWDLDSGRELCTLQGHESGVEGVALSKDGRLAISASDDNTLKVWDVAGGRELHTLRSHKKTVEAVAVSGNGRLAVSASDDRTLKVWDIESGRELRTLRGHKSEVMSVALSEDGRLAVSASFRELKVWDVESGRPLRTIMAHSKYVLSVALTPDGRRAVSCSLDNAVHLWEVDTGRELQVLTGHLDIVGSVAVSADCRLAISASHDYTLKTWDLESGRERGTLRGHSSYVRGVALCADGMRAVSASADRTLKVWDLGTCSESGMPLDHPKTVSGIAVSREKRLAVSSSLGGTLKLWDLGAVLPIGELIASDPFLSGVALSADGTKAVSSSWDHTLCVWDLVGRCKLRTLRGHTDCVEAVALSADGTIAVSACRDGSLKIWSVDEGREIHTLRGHTQAVHCVSISSDDRLVVSGSYDKTLKIWDVQSGRELRTLDSHSQVLGVAIDQQLLFSALGDCSIKIWDLESGRELRTLNEHAGHVSCVALSPDCRRAVSTSSDKTVRVWDLANGRSLAVFTCDSSAVCCAFINNLDLIAGDDAGYVHFLRLEEPKAKR